MLEHIKDFFRKYKKLILIILAIILLLIIIIFSIPQKQETETTPTSTIRGSQLEQPTIVKGTITKEDKEKSSASVVAKTFTEIYGSYSNQSNYLNLENSLSLLSASFKSEIQSLLTKSRASYASGASYEGVTTVVINITVESLDETTGKATLLLKTQRKESKGTQANFTIKYQDIRLNLVKESSVWLIDGANWQ